MIKRKRLDARIYKELFSAQTKKGKVSGEATPESRDVKLDTSHSHREKQRIDSEGKSQPGNGKAMLTKFGSSASENCDQDQASSSTDVLLHKSSHGEMMEDSAPSAKDRLEDLPECQTKLPRYIEYWVPVGLSYVQLEKYCETLIKNSMLLCSSLKKEVLDGLHEILTTIRKCCDHPYLVDSSLQKFVNDGRSVGDYLSNGIEVSGKLFLLDKLLQEVKEKQLRALIVFQLIDSKPQSNNLEHFLDDLICAKVGEGCYVHIYREFDSAKRRAALDLFNDKENGKLVMLIEKNSCQPSIKLSSVDCVILFNSDWKPTSDMKSLRKMSIQSKSDHLKVFRLYSSHSVEEKALFFAKEGSTQEINLNNFSHNITHMLLLWGTSYLFSKLDELHSHCSSIGSLNCLCDDKLATDVVNELYTILSCEDSNSISCSLISKVPEFKDDYSQKIGLHGEQDEPARDADLPPFAVWSSLLEGRNPLWKLLPGSSERIRRRGELLSSPALHIEGNNEDAKISSQRTSHFGGGSLCPKPRVRKVCRPASGKRAGKIDGHSKSVGNAVNLSPCRDDYSSPSQIDEICQQRMKELVQKQKEEIRAFYRTKREEKGKLDEQHQSEVDLMNKKYGETALKQERLKNLDLIYEQKLEKHNREMDTKRKELEGEHLASRIKENQLAASLKKNYLGTPTTSLAETAAGQQTVELIENPIDSATMISNTAPISESKHSPEIELGMINASVQRDDPGFSPDHVLTETVILSVASDEENDAISILREEVCDTADCNIEDPIRASHGEAEMRGATDSGTSATVIVQQRVEAVGASNGEAEIRSAADSDATATMTWQQSIEEVPDGGCNIETPVGSSNGEAEMRGNAGSGTAAAVAGQQRVEAVLCGDSNSEALIEAFSGEAEMRVAADLGTSNTLAGQQRIEDVQCADSNMEARIGPVIGEADMSIAADLGTTAVVAEQQSIEELPCGGSNIEAPIGSANGVAEMRVVADSCTTTTMAGQQRVEEGQDRDANIETPFRESNGESEMRGAAVLGTTATVAGQQRIEELMEFPSSILNVGSQGMVQSQACTMTENSSPLEQPMFSANLPCNVSRQTAGVAAIPNFHTSVRTSCQNQVPVGSFGSFEQPVLLSLPQLSVGWEQPRIQHPAGTAILQSVYNSFQESSTLRCRQSDALQNEILRLKKEEEEAEKNYEDKKKQLKSSCEKEIQEVQKKYDLLLREAEKALAQKKVEVSSHCRKVYANKLLADTLKSSIRKQLSSSMSQEALLNAILQLSPQQFNSARHGSSMGSAEATPPPVQVVNELSELISLDTTRPHNFSTLHQTGDPLAGYHARASAPHLCAPRLVTSASTSNISTSIYGVMNQQTAVWPPGSMPSFHQLGLLSGSSLQLGGTMQNPLFQLGGTSQNPLLL